MFDTHAIATLELRGRALVAPQAISNALGYAQPDTVVTMIGRDWSDEFVDGVHTVTISGPELAAVKATAPGVVGARAPSLTLLTEEGLWLVLMLTKKPAGKALRRWLSTEALPAWRQNTVAAPHVEAGPMVDEDAVRARVLVELHGEGVLDDRALVKRLDDEQITALPGAVLGPLVRRLASGEAPPVAAPRKAIAPAAPRTTGAQVVAALQTWADGHAAQVMVDIDAPAPAGGWRARWVEPGIAMTPEAMQSACEGAGLTVADAVRALQEEGLLLRDGRHLTRPITLARGGAARLRCYVVCGPKPAGAS